MTAALTGRKIVAVRRRTVTSFQVNICSDRPLADPARIQATIADAISAYLGRPAPQRRRNQRSGPRRPAGASHHQSAGRHAPQRHHQRRASPLPPGRP